MEIFINPVESIYLGKAWAGNSVNAVAFRSHGILSLGKYTYTTFYKPDGKINVIQIGLDGALFSEICINSNILPTDAHRALSLGLDCAKRIHLSWGAHNSALAMAHSLTGSLDDGFSDPYLLDGGNTYTYPVFLQFTSNDNPLLLLRSGRYDAADIIVKRLNTVSCQWVDDPTPLIDGRQGPWTSGPYLDIPGLAQKEKIEITYCWRLSPRASSVGLVGNIGVDHFSSSDQFHSLESTSGVVLSKPITPASSQRIYTVPLGYSLMNQTSCTSSASGNFFLATLWNDSNGCPQYYLVWRKGLCWICSCLTGFSTKFFLSGKGTLPLPHSRPKILVDKDDVVYLLWRSIENHGKLALSVFYPPSYERAGGQTFILWDKDLGQYEPVVDYGAWAAQEMLVLYVQHCSFAHDNSQSSIGIESDARILKWPLSYMRKFLTYEGKYRGM